MTQQQPTYDELVIENIKLKSEISTYRKLVFGQKNERFVPIKNDNQLSLIQGSKSPVEVQTEQVTYTRRKTIVKRAPHGRQKLPTHLPREQVILEPDEDVTGLKKIGEEITEELEYKPGKLYVKQYIRPKYEARNESGVIIGLLPYRPIEKGIAGPGLLAHILMSKFVDHIPLNRQVTQFKRQDVRIPGSTINDWLNASCDALLPLKQLLRESTLHCSYLQADETTVRVQDPRKKGKTHTGYFWLYHNPEQRLLFFDYRPGRDRAGPSEILRNFGGYLQTDGYRSYDEIVAKNDMIRLGCMAHARRKFYDARDGNPKHCEWMLTHIGKLYDIERRARDNKLNVKERFELREKYARPILASIKEWLDEKLLSTSSHTDLGVAISYMLNQWPRLNNYLLDGCLEIDNNLIENAVRPVALGRKNWLFAGSHESAKRSALIYSLLGTAKLHGVEPYSYLKDVLTRINGHSIKRLDELLPHKWASINK